MSSRSHLTASQTNETIPNKRHSSFNLQAIPSDDSSDLLHSSAPTTNPSCLYNVNTEPDQKQSIIITQNLTPRPSIKEHTLNVRRKLSAISLNIPWNKRSRLPSDDKTSTDSIAKHSQQQRKSLNPGKMSRDRLLTLDRLFSSGTNTAVSPNDDESASPTSEFTALDESVKSNENTKAMKENGYLHNSNLMAR
jgi:hypothetical protein